MKQINSAVLAAALIAMTGCRRVEKSPIVKVFEDAGGGNATSRHRMV